jgi:hypothetical protein
MILCQGIPVAFVNSRDKIVVPVVDEPPCTAFLMITSSPATGDLVCKGGFKLAYRGEPWYGQRRLFNQKTLEALSKVQIAPKYKAWAEEITLSRRRRDEP